MAQAVAAGLRLSRCGGGRTDSAQSSSWLSGSGSSCHARVSVAVATGLAALWRTAVERVERVTPTQAASRMKVVAWPSPRAVVMQTSAAGFSSAALVVHNMAASERGAVQTAHDAPRQPQQWPRVALSFVAAAEPGTAPWPRACSGGQDTAGDSRPYERRASGPCAVRGSARADRALRPTRLSFEFGGVGLGNGTAAGHALFASIRSHTAHTLS